MITRILIDNYRCFEGTVIEPTSLSLLLGPNGAGKSTVFEVLFKLRQLVTGGDSAASLFPDTTRTRWSANKTQTFELSLRGDDGLYLYRVVMDHGGKDGSVIGREEVLHDGEPLYRFEKEVVTLYRLTTADVEYPAGDKVSPLSNLPRRFISKQLAWVTDRISRIWVFRPVPPLLEALAHAETSFLALDLSNFTSWLFSEQATRPAVGRALKRSLRDVLEGFRDYRFEPQGMRKQLLQFWFAAPRGRKLIPFAFNELSEGQRALVVLYTLLHAVAGKASTLCIDEPENFLAPREIHPWINQLMDVTEAGGQALLISHSPRLIDFLAASHGIILDRPEGGPATVHPVPEQQSGLPISELVARGWLDG